MYNPLVRINSRIYAHEMYIHVMIVLNVRKNSNAYRTGLEAPWGGRIPCGYTKNRGSGSNRKHVCLYIQGEGVGLHFAWITCHRDGVLDILQNTMTSSNISFGFR